jgi:tRNA(Ile)-lysidine synthase
VLLPGVDALRSFGTLRLAPLGSFVQEKRHYRVPLNPGVEAVLPHHAGRIYLQLSEAYSTAGICVNFKSEKERNETVMLGLDALGGREALHRLVVRNWEPGDKFQPAGHKNAKKIKELFQESKVLLWERKHWPVLELNDQIVWSRRFGPAACFVPEQSTHPVVALSYRAADESIAVLRTS